MGIAGQTLEVSHIPSEAPLRLPASRDKVTGGGVFPRIPDSSPAASRYAPIELSETAALYSFTIIHPSPKTGLPPFALAYADFPEDVRVFGRLNLPDGQRPRIGMALRPVRPEGGTYVFVPAAGGAA